MFKTHESMEMGLMGLFSEDHRFWRMIERDTSTPWFHMTIQYRMDGDIRKRTLMPDDITLLAHLVSQQDEEVHVIDLQAMTPGRMNKQGRWIMEPLAKLELAQTADDGIVHLYTTVDGSTYCDPYQDDAELAQLRDRTVLYVRPTAPTAAGLAT